ncbi:FKBP-type peptidyl-prolyl cis-trans isomerase [Marinilabiliaceae bacterium ANBcel2]|nr:FKBP-type peptidyl-prolyl cis-trans isomerase [Marinilabiliaceae bacterium ANBcel2]
MKLNNLLVVIALILIVTSACSRRVPGSGKVELENRTDSVSYALGYLEAQQYEQMVMISVFDSLDKKSVAALFSDVDINEEYGSFRDGQFNGFNSEIFKTAFINQLAYDFSYFDEATANAYVNKVFNSASQEREAGSQERASKASGDGAAFLEENAERDEVIQLESGLQYEIIEEGSGGTPGAGDRVQVHYHGTLIDGQVFDSSVQRGEPAVFGVNQVIAGWTEGLQMMSVGSKWKLYIPPHLAYGDQGAGDVIGPNETLIFEVELLDIE